MFSVIQDDNGSEFRVKFHPNSSHRSLTLSLTKAYKHDYLFLSVILLYDRSPCLLVIYYTHARARAKTRIKAFYSCHHFTNWSRRQTQSLFTPPQVLGETFRFIHKPPFSALGYRT